MKASQKSVFFDPACSSRCFSPVSPFLISMSLDLSFQTLVYGSCFFPERLFLRVSITLLQRFAQNLMHLPSDLSQNRISPDTQLQIKGHKKSIHPPSCINVVHLLPTYANTISYCCITLLQVLYRRQHQSRKLWIAIT
jgi:hypothetical protein